MELTEDEHCMTAKIQDTESIVSAATARGTEDSQFVWTAGSTGAELLARRGCMQSNSQAATELNRKEELQSCKTKPAETTCESIAVRWEMGCPTATHCQRKISINEAGSLFSNFSDIKKLDLVDEYGDGEDCLMVQFSTPGSIERVLVRHQHKPLCLPAANNNELIYLDIEAL